MNVGQTIEVRLTAIRYAARDINLFEFSGIGPGSLPAAAPGAHVDLHLPGGLVRQYSLVETGADLATYTVGIKREAQSRGGSSFVFDRLKVGDVLSVSPPRNNFRLEESAPASIFVAGGIGITPIHAMMRRLSEIGRPWNLYYACRSRADLPGFGMLSRMSPEQVHLHIDDESAGTFLDLDAVVAAAPPGAHLYCCGPAPMLSAFEKATAAWPADRVHVEHFAAREAVQSTRHFVVRLSRSNREFTVPAGKTILGVLRAAGMRVAFSCEEGVCGACETAVLSGIPEHRDSILTASERAANDTMMICCGGARSDVLLLDL